MSLGRLWFRLGTKRTYKFTDLLVVAKETKDFFSLPAAGAK